MPAPPQSWWRRKWNEAVTGRCRDISALPAFVFSHLWRGDTCPLLLLSHRLHEHVPRPAPPGASCSLLPPWYKVPQVSDRSGGRGWKGGACTGRMQVGLRLLSPRASAALSHHVAVDSCSLLVTAAPSSVKGQVDGSCGWRCWDWNRRSPEGPSRAAPWAALRDGGRG